VCCLIERPVWASRTRDQDRSGDLVVQPLAARPVVSCPQIRQDPYPLRKPDIAPIPHGTRDSVTCDDTTLTSSRDGVDVRWVVERVGGVNRCFGGGDVPVAPWILECLTGWGLCGHRGLAVGSSRTPSHRCKHGSALDPDGYVLSCPCYPEQGAVALLTGERNRARVRRPRNMLALWSGRGGCYSPIISRERFGRFLEETFHG